MALLSKQGTVTGQNSQVWALLEDDMLGLLVAQNQLFIILELMA